MATILLDHESGATSIVDVSYATKLAGEPFPETLDRARRYGGHDPPVARATSSKSPMPRYRRTRRRAELAALGLAALAQYPGKRLCHPAALGRSPRPPGRNRATSGADNLKTFALVEAAYDSAAPGQDRRCRSLAEMSDRTPSSSTAPHRPNPPASPERRKTEADLAADGNLRTIRYDGIEVLRAISYLVRDRDWGTYSPDDRRSLLSSRVTIGFTVRYRRPLRRTRRHESRHCRIASAATRGWQLTSEQRPPPTGFETNRCGFCMLHPDRRRRRNAGHGRACRWRRSRHQACPI